MLVMRPATRPHRATTCASRPWQAYNTTEGHLDFHPREREDVGYVLTLGGSRIYIAGDGENTPE